ncbi:MAG TPA: hypothetical protein VIH98_12355 [Xanthobacteraceae bacterium]|jgi:hypothetical protein
MADETRPMVLQSISLPPELDDQLRAVAFALSVRKSDLIRLFISKSLHGLVKHLSSVSESEEEIQNIRKEFLARLAEIDRSYPESERQKLREDFSRIQRFLDHHQKGAAGGITEPQFLAGKAAGTQN